VKKCVLSFLRKLVRDEISLMSDDSAFQARGPAMENALSVRWSRVRGRQSCRSHWTETGCHDVPSSTVVLAIVLTIQDTLKIFDDDDDDRCMRTSKYVFSYSVLSHLSCRLTTIKGHFLCPLNVFDCQQIQVLLTHLCFAALYFLLDLAGRPPLRKIHSMLCSIG